MGRVSRLTPASRALVDLVSVVPGRAELELVDSVLRPSEEAASEAEAAGGDSAQGERSHLSSRTRPPLGRDGSTPDQAAGDQSRGPSCRGGPRLRRVTSRSPRPGRWRCRCSGASGPLAARRAAAMESHSEAVAHLRALEPYLDQLEPEMCADHYDLWAFEEYLGSEIGWAEEIIEIGIGIRRRLDDPEKLGNSLLIGSRSLGCGIAERLPPRWPTRRLRSSSRSVGSLWRPRYSAISQLAMLAGDESARAGTGRRPWQWPARGRVRPAHALNNIGTAKTIARYPEGMEELEESCEMSADIHSSHDQIRAAVNISWAAIYHRDLATAELWAAWAHELSIDREIASFDAYVTGELALIDEMRGNWAEAEAKVCFVLDTLAELGTANIVASTLLGRLQARRGEPDAKTHLMDGWDALQAKSPADHAGSDFTGRVRLDRGPAR